MGGGPSSKKRLGDFCLASILINFLGVVSSISFHINIIKNKWKDDILSVHCLCWIKSRSKLCCIWIHTPWCDIRSHGSKIGMLKTLWEISHIQTYSEYVPNSWGSGLLRIFKKKLICRVEILSDRRCTHRITWYPDFSNTIFSNTRFCVDEKEIRKAFTQVRRSSY